MTAAWVLLCAFVVFYIVFQLGNDFSPSLKTGNVSSASETLTETFDAYFMRNEKVLTSRFNGYVDYFVADGGYSGTENELLRVYEKNSDEISARIAELDRRIALLDVLINNTGTGSLGRAGETVRSSYRELTSRLSSRRLSEALNEKDSVLNSMYILEQNKGSRSDISKRLSDARKTLSELRIERKELLSSLGAYESIYSDSTGNLFHSSDGLEAAYSAADIDKLTLSELAAMLSSVPDQSTDERNAVGCFSGDFIWYMAIPCDMTRAVGFTVGKSYKVSFPYTSGAVLSMELCRLVSESDSQAAFLIFSCGSYPDGFDRTRCQKAIIEKAVYDGYRVPLNAIRQENNRIGIYALSNGKVYWKDADIIYKNDLYCIVSPQSADPAEFDKSKIGLNDTYVLGGRGLYEGKLVN